MVIPMCRRLVAFFLSLPLMFFVATGEFILSVSSASTSYEKSSDHSFSHTHDIGMGSLAFHDDSSHFHETVGPVVSVPLKVSEYFPEFSFFYSDTHPIWRLYPLLRPPMVLMV